MYQQILTEWCYIPTKPRTGWLPGCLRLLRYVLLQFIFLSQWPIRWPLLFVPQNSQWSQSSATGRTLCSTCYRISGARWWCRCSFGALPMISPPSKKPKSKHSSCKYMNASPVCTRVDYVFVSPSLVGVFPPLCACFRFNRYIFVCMNAITPCRYYPLFGLMANVALIFSGQYVKYVSGLRASLPAGTSILHCMYSIKIYWLLKFSTSLSVFCCFVALFARGTNWHAIDTIFCILCTY